MEKKSTKNSGQQSKNGQDVPKLLSLEFTSKKYGCQSVRKREQEKGECIPRRPLSSHVARTGQRYGRSREKVDCQIAEKKTCETGSLQRGGSKKQNITHLLNWWDSYDYYGRSHHGTGSQHGAIRRSTYVRYNKESYLQANCQFVVRVGEDYSAWQTNPDCLVDWNFVEEVRLHVSDDPFCPICLYPPVAAKVTRCGHIYCFPCVLHYLALSDDKWRKCPICYEPIEKDDLKSVSSILRQDLQQGDTVEMHLMRRDRDSLVPCPMWAYTPDIKVGAVASFADASSKLSNVKLIVAGADDIVETIIQREMDDLLCKMEAERDEPEACFIEEAITLVNSRKEQLLLKKETVEISGPNKKATRGNKMKSNELKEVASVKFQSSSDVEMDQDRADFSGSQSLNSLDKVCADFSQKLAMDSTEGGQSSDADCEHIRAEQKEANLEEAWQEDKQAVNIQSPGQSVARQQHMRKIEQRNAPKSVFYFYQLENGSHVYLHGLNTHMLMEQYGSLENAPHKISGKVLEIGSANVTKEFRQRNRYLQHLPLTCRFELVEIELAYGLVSEEVMKKFEGKIKAREMKRRKRLKEEKKICKRAKKEEDRIMGKVERRVDVKIDSLEYFPSFDTGHASDTSFASLDEAAGCSTLESSVSSCESSLSSFAQVTSSTRTPVQQKPVKKTASSVLACQAAAKQATSDTDDEADRAPDFKESFSDAFAKALEKVARDRDAGAGASKSNSGGQKKKKKRKQVVLLSSGGR